MAAAHLVRWACGVCACLGRGRRYDRAAPWPGNRVRRALDSIADAALYLTAPIAALVLYPVLRERERVTVIVVLAAYLVPIAIGFVKYRRLTAYHTIAARAAGMLLGVAFMLLVVFHLTWPLRAAAVLLVLSAIEEIAITLVLPSWRANVPSLRHALGDSKSASGRRGISGGGVGA